MSVSDPDGDSLTVTFYGRRITTAMDFVLAIFGDTQNYYSVYQSTGIDYFKAQAQWIAANRAAKNFAYVAHMGDVTNNNLDPEWVYASNAMSFLEDRITTGLQDGIPLGVEVGNHDQRNSTTAPYNQYFGSSRYAGRDYYGGHYGSSNNNYYELFSAGGMDFIVLYLEFGVASKPDALNWADQLLKQYVNRHGIVVSHEMLYPGDPAPWHGDGLTIYNALKNNPNLFLMLCGHAGADYKRSDVYNGNTVHTIMTDYSGESNGGNGYIRLLNISRTNNNIHATTYSPTAGDRSASPIWDLPFNSFPVLGVTSASGPEATFTWNNLATCSQYEWYVTVRDSQSVTTGPRWTFATVGCSISGTVTNGLGVGIAGAAVSYSGGSTTTDAAGNYTLSSVDPGTYDVTTTASGYQNSTQTVTVTLGQSAIANFTLTGGASSVTLVPTSLTFSNQLVGTTSPSQSVTLHNGGSTAVTISSVGATGDFSLNSHCGSSLSGNSSCMIDVSFAPTAAGTRNGTLAVTESTPSATQTVTLTGSGVAPTVSLSPTSLTFGNQPLNVASAAQAVTLANTGSAGLTINSISVTGANAADFAQMNNCGSSVAVGASCTISVTFTPTATGARNASLSIADNASDSPQTVSLTGTGEGTPAPVVSLSASSLSFGEQGLNSTSLPQAVTLTNSGTATVTVSDITASGDFAQTNDCVGSLNMGASCQINVTFTPTAAGTRNGTLTVTESSPGATQTVALTGTGVVPTVSLTPTSMTFGNQALNTSSPAQTVTLTNNGNTALSINGISISGTTAFRFASWSDAQDGGGHMYVTSNKIAALNPAFTLFNGDLSRDGVILSPATSPDSMQVMSNAMRGNPEGIGSNDNGVFGKTFLDRGNGDNHYDNPGDWQSFFASYPEAQGSMSDRVARIGGHNYSYMSGQDNLTYSFDYKNSRFIMVDVPGSSNNLTSSEVTWIDQRLTDAETNHPELIHAFISMHGAFYCVSYNCSCSGQRASCLGSAASSLVPVINKHPIVSAFFNGHDHNLGWTHLDSTRISNLTHPVEQFMTSPSGSSTYNRYVQFDASGTPYRFDYVETAIEDQAFGIIDVNGSSYTVSLYREGTENPVWSHSFSKSGNPGDGTGIADFSQTNTCGSSVAAGASCTISVTFTPTATGTRSASLSIADNASDSPQTVNLTGTGEDTPAPVVSLSASSLTFSSQAVGTTSTAQTATLSNTGSAALTINGVSMTGTNAGDFSQTNTCGSSVAAGGNCTISVTFTPIATGTRTAAVSISDGVPNSPQSISLTGTGTAPSVNYSPASLNFGNQSLNTTSSAQSVIVTNNGSGTLNISGVSITGNNAGDFSKSSDNCTGAPVNPSSSCTISVTFTPTVTGSRAASLSIADNATGSPHTVSLSGNGTAATVSLSPASLNFGSQRLNTTSPAQAVTLSNTGNAALAISGISVTGTNAGDFAQSNNCGSSVAAGGNCTISVTFTPTATGARAASVSISDEASGSPQSVSMSGTGESAPAPVVSLSPPSLTFSSQVVGTTSTAQTVMLSNTGSAALTISGISVTGANAGDFSQTNACGTTLASGTNCTINVTFTPTATGARNASLSISDNASGSPQSVSLSGTGESAPAPVVSLSPTSLSFIDQTLNTTSSPRTVTLSNTGNAVLTISGISVTGANAGDFAQSNNCGSSVAAGANCSISVTFRPVETGTRTAAVSIADNAAGSPQMINLTGTGVLGALSVTSVSPNSLPAGGTGTLKITGTNFVPTATVSFGGPGRAPTVNSLTVVSSTEIDVMVTTYANGPKRERICDVTVINPDGSSGTLAEGFTVTYP